MSLAQGGAAADDAFRAEQSRLLYSAVPAAIAGNIGVGALLAIVQWPLIEPAAIAAWLALLASSLGARALLAVMYRRSAPAADHSLWLGRFRIGIAATGVTWGCGALLLFPPGDVAHQAFLAFALAGVTAGAATSLAVDRVSTALFAIPALGPLLIPLLIEATSVSLAMAGMLALFLAFVLVSIRDTPSSLRRSVRLWIESERFSRATLDSIRARVAVLDGAGRIVASNAGWQAFAKTAEAEWEAAGDGTDYLSACERAVGERAEEARAIAAGIREVIAGRLESFEREYAGRYGGEQRRFLCRASRLGHGAASRVVVTHDDVTSVHQALERAVAGERMFASLAGSSPVGLFRNDPEGRCLYVNGRWCEMTGLTAEEALGEGWMDAVHPADRDGVLAGWRAAVQAQGPAGGEYRMRRPDGSVVWVLGQVVPIRDAEGRATGYVGTVSDVTDRKRVELSLRALSTDLVALDGAAYLDAAARKLTEILEVDIAFIARLDAARRDDVTAVAMIDSGRSLADAVLPLAGTPCAEVLKGAPKIVPRDARRLYPADAYFAAERIDAYAGEPLLDPTGKAIGQIGVLSRKPFADPAAVETTLRLFAVAVAAAMVRQRSRQQYEDLFEFATDALVIASREGLIMLANRQTEALFGWTREELVGQPVEMLVPAELRGGHVALREAFVAAANSRLMAAGRADLRVRRRDGTEFFAEISLAPMPSQDGQVIAAVRDVTARRVAEQAAEEARANLRDAIESIQESIVLCDRDDRIAVCNRRFADDVKGLASPGMPFEDLVRAAVAKGVFRVAAGEEEAFVAQFMGMRRRADGLPSVRELADGRRISVTCLPAVGGGIISVGADVTDRLRTEDRLREMQKMEAIGKLTGGLAHDFNNYLSVIIGNLDLLKERESTDQVARQFIDTALAGALRGAELTHSLLAFSRRQPLAPSRTDVNPRLAAVVGMLKRTLGEDILVSKALAADLWPTMIDGGQFDSCIVNLANNARHAMPGGGSLRFATRNVALDDRYGAANPDVAPGDYVLIEVSDSGTGMTPETLSRVFEPFFTTREPGRGTGLGLSMVYGFVKQSGGHIKIDSEVGRGTTVRIYLPRMAAADATFEEPATLEGTAPAQGEMILVVEDNEQVRQAAVMQLSQFGYRIIEAENARSALAIIERPDQPVDLLFTDIVMPGGINGQELARLSRERRPALRVLLTSGYPGEAPSGGPLVALGFPMLHKPYRREELRRAVRSALDAPSGAGAPEGGPAMEPAQI